MKFEIRHDGSVTITASEGDTTYLAPPGKWFVNEFEIEDGRIVNFKQRKLK